MCEKNCIGELRENSNVVFNNAVVTNISSNESLVLAEVLESTMIWNNRVFDYIEINDGIFLRKNFYIRLVFTNTNLTKFLTHYFFNFLESSIYFNNIVVISSQDKIYILVHS